MNFLIRFFQGRLGCSWEVATARVQRLAFLLVTALAFIVLAVFLFRIMEHSSQKSVELLPGEHTIVSTIVDGDVVVDRESFIDLAYDNPSFVAQTKMFVSYFAEVEGVGFRFNLGLGSSWRNRISESTLQSGGLAVNDPVATGESNAWYPSVILIGFALFMYLLFWALGYEDGKRLRLVWWPKPTRV